MSSDLNDPKLYLNGMLPLSLNVGELFISRSPGGGVQVTGTYEPVSATEHMAPYPQGSDLEGGFASAGHLFLAFGGAGGG
jgi:hypothetical protein